MLNKHICKAQTIVASIHWTIDDLEDAITWAEEETEINKNTRTDNTTNQDFFDYCEEELRHQNNNLEKAKVRLDICVKTFNKGWTF